MERTNGIKVTTNNGVNIVTNKIETIKTLITNAACEFGGNGNIAYLEQAYHACNPSREFGWDCYAVQIDGNAVVLGEARWDFEDDVEDASDYDWENGGDEMYNTETFDISDDDDADYVIAKLSKK